MPVAGHSSSNKTAGKSYYWPALPTGWEAGPVEYHQGPVMTGKINVYPIFYGNWTGDFGESVVKGFIDSIGSAAADGKAVPSVREWWNINTPYYQIQSNKKSYVAPAVVYKKSITISKKFRKTLADGFDGGKDDIKKIVLQQIKKNAIPEDVSGFYPIMVKGDIKMSSRGGGLCTTYCGFHGLVATPSGKQLKYALVGDGTLRCNWGCGHNMGMKRTPNGFYAMDSLMSTFAHELAEAATDPDVASGWYAVGDYGGFENADLCNGIYKDSNVKSLPVNTGSYAYSLQGVGNQRFLIQSNVDINAQRCVLRRKT